ncbi:MAG: hypothetical protein KQH79_14475 [Bacteroidetes bacterium]|nr:hypothetical protein [Bacteroidota bacterium]
MNQISKHIKNPILIFIALSLVFAFIAIKLSDIPFGWQFNFSIVIVLISIIGFLISISFRLYRNQKKWIKLTLIFPLILTIVLLVIGLSFVKSFEFIAHKGPACNMNKQLWEEDLNFLIGKYASDYPDIFGQIDSIELVHKIDRVRKYIESGTENQIRMSIFEMHASLNDAHSIPLFFNPAYDLHFFPIRIYPFNEGWFVTDAGRNQKDCIGNKLIAINNVPIDTIFDNYRGAFSYESDAGKTERFKMWGLMAEWLYFKDYISELDHAIFTFRTADGKKNIKIYIYNTRFEHDLLDLFK